MTRTEERPPVFGGKRQIAEAIARRERLFNLARDSLYGHFLVDDIENDLDEMSTHDRYEYRMCENARHLGVSNRPAFARGSDRPFSKVATNNDRAKLLGLDHCLTQHEWSNILEEFRNSCAYCGVGDDDPQMDHVVPICLGGGTEKRNVVPCCSRCNSQKLGSAPKNWLGPTKLAEIAERLRRANP